MVTGVGEYVLGKNAAGGLSAAKILLDATGKWKDKLRPRRWQVADFLRLIDRNSVLGFPENLKRTKYATTPVIEAMGSEEDFGAVSVLMVPSSNGKTTAAYYFMKKNNKQIRGIAFCRQDKSTPYVKVILQLLGLNSENPPDGWLTCLIDALNDGSTSDKRRPVLILDEFFSSEQDDADASLILTLKLLLTNSSVRVLVLTPSEKYADYLLTLNQMQGIVPFASTYPRDEYPVGKWKNMRWPIATLKIAAIHDPLFAPFGTRVDSEIDDIIKGMTEEKVMSLTIRQIQNELRKRLLPPEDPLGQLEVETDVSSSVAEEEMPKYNCTNCCIS